MTVTNTILAFINGYQIQLIVLTIFVGVEAWKWASFARKTPTDKSFKSYFLHSKVFFFVNFLLSISCLTKSLDTAGRSTFGGIAIYFVYFPVYIILSLASVMGYKFFINRK